MVGVRGHRGEGLDQQGLSITAAYDGWGGSEENIYVERLDGKPLSAWMPTMHELNEGGGRECEDFASTAGKGRP